MLLPSDHERKWYYYGLVSHPQLVARSNAATMQWQLRFEDEHPIKKRLGRVGQHPIVNKSETSSLSKDIIGLLDATLEGWNCIDVLRIGESNAQHTNPVILWIGVLPNSTSSQIGMNVALRCRAILQRYGLDDVHCEIREAVVQPAASLAARNQPIVKNLDVNVDEITHSGFHFPAFTDTIGQCVAMEADPTREATLCCFISLAKERDTPPAKYAVISRHLVFANDDISIYRYHKSSPMKHVIMPGDRTLKEAKATTAQVLDSWTRRLTQLQHHQSSPDQQQQAQMVESVRQHIARAKKFYDYLGTITNPETRRIGYVEYSPSRQLNVQTGNLPDFAMVKLDQARFKARIEDMANMVYIADKPDLSDLNKGLTWNVYAFPQGSPVLRLRGFVPIADLTPPWNECGRETIMGETVLRVGERGAKTGLTWGEVNELKSVVRETFDGQKVASQSLTVLGFDKKAFSDNGDSGSAIFTPDGKMVAMLDAGRSPCKPDLLTGGVTVHDVTYGTPFAWILDYIRDAGYATAHLC